MTVVICQRSCGGLIGSVLPWIEGSRLEPWLGTLPYVLEQDCTCVAPGFKTISECHRRYTDYKDFAGSTDLKHQRLTMIPV